MTRLVPNPKSPTYLCSQEFGFCAQYRLGVQMNDGTLACNMCLEVMDAWGDHSMNCQHGRGKVVRHNTVRDIIADRAKAANLSPRTEVEGLIAGNRGRPADILIPSFPVGRDTIIDVTVVNPLQSNAIARAAYEAGVAMDTMKRRKRNQYLPSLNANQVFKPVAFESFGGWDSEGEALVRKISSVLARNQGKEESEVHRYTVQRISCAIQRGNAISFVDRLRREAAVWDDDPN